MATFYTHSDHMPCSECGASVPAADHEQHICDPERRLDFRMFQFRDEVAAFEELFTAYLDSSAGQFAQWLAQHERPPC